MGMRVFKAEVPVDDQWHPIHAPRVVHVHHQYPRTVTLWFESLPSDDPNVPTMEFCVYGTGHPVPIDAAYVGTTHDGPYVWHLYQRPITP